MAKTRLRRFGYRKLTDLAISLQKLDAMTGSTKTQPKTEFKELSKTR
jgi:hypothetical protein